MTNLVVNMKSNWQTKKLGEICNFQGGSQPPKSNFIFTPRKGYVRFLQIRDFGSDKHITFIPESNKNRYCNEDDILLGRYGASVGKILINKKGAYNVAVMKTIPKVNILNKKYLYFYLISDDFQKRLNKVAARSAQAGFSKVDIYNFPVLTPSLPEQHRVVKILDKVFGEIEKARENMEKNMKNSKDLFESYLQSIFIQQGRDWEQKNIGEVLQKTETINPKNNPDKEFIYIDVSSVNKENLSIENTSLIKGKNAPSRARKLIKTGDVIFATVRPTLRRIAIISKKYNEQVCSTGYFVLRTKETVNNKLVFYYLQTKEFFKQMEKLQKGASYPAVTDGDVRNQIISYPKALSEQKTIVKKLDELSEKTKRLEEIYMQKLADLEELKKSILKQAFEGNL